MGWCSYIAYFFAGALLANGVPHFVHGISGKRFQSPFASPPGIGESSAPVNVIWGLANFIIGYVLICGIGDFTFGFTLDTMITGLSATVTSIALALYFGPCAVADFHLGAI